MQEYNGKLGSGGLWIVKLVSQMSVSWRKKRIQNKNTFILYLLVYQHTKAKPVLYSFVGKFHEVIQLKSDGPYNPS